MFEQFNFSPGIVVHNPYTINTNDPLNEDEVDYLQEDMFQAEYPKNYILDVGWYSGIKKFIVFVIIDRDWEEPEIRIECKDWMILHEVVQSCHQIIIKLLDR